jgi:hypothetical protein
MDLLTCTSVCDGDTEVVEWMIKDDPDLKMDEFPFDVNMVGAQWIFQKYLRQPEFFGKYFWIPDLIVELLIRGNVEVAKYFLTNLHQLNPMVNRPSFSADMIPKEFFFCSTNYKPSFLNDVCRQGYLSVLQFACQQNWFPKIKWPALHQIALEARNFHIVEWIEPLMKLNEKNLTQ